MIAERDENYRLICAKRGTHWQVEVRAGAWWAVGSPSPDLLEAVEIHVRLVISLLETPPSDPARNEPQRVRDFAAKFLSPMIW